MQEKSNKMITYGFLTLLFLLLFSMTTVTRPDNAIYPVNNFFVFGKSGSITENVYNQSFFTEMGTQVHSIINEQPAYKYRLIFAVPEKPFDTLSMKVRILQGL